MTGRLISRQRHLGRLSQGRDNNFQLLRFVAASLVVFTHSFGLTGHGEIEPLYQLAHFSLGSLGVDVFFVISGFLICKSWYSRLNIIEFLFARFQRIYPALWVAVAFCALVIGPIFTRFPIGQYLSHLDLYKFVAENATLLPKGVFTTLPGVFQDHSLVSVNSPLWTLPYELKMYLLLAALSIIGLTARCIFLPTFVAVAFVGFTLAYSGWVPKLMVATEWLRFLFFFFAGSLCYVHRERIYISRHLAATVIILFAIAFIMFTNEDVRRLSVAFATPYIVMFLAFGPSGHVRAFNRLGDYSYGIYIYGFPIQQCVLTITGSTSVVWNFAVSWVCCLVVAAASWHLLEEPALGRRMPDWLARMSRLSLFRANPAAVSRAPTVDT